MKKIFCILACASFGFLLCSCVNHAQLEPDSTSKFETSLATTCYDEANKIDEAIMSIGDVSLDKRGVIKHARFLYNTADDSIRKQVIHLSVLEQAEVCLSNLEIENVIEKINQIDQVTLGNKSIVEDAASAYRVLKPEQKGKITNYDLLEKASTELSDLKVQNAIEAIEEIGEVSLENKSTIENAESIYRELTIPEQEKVYNHDILEDVSAQLFELELDQADDIFTDVYNKKENHVVTMGQKNALESAKSYIRYKGFSYSGLIEQLKFDGYTQLEAQYGADHCGADWMEQAVRAAKSYLNYKSFSKQGLVEQLEFDGFTNEEAIYGVTHAGY